jgi:hypothetical protein
MPPTPPTTPAQPHVSRFKALLPSLEKVRGWRVRVFTVVLALVPVVALVIAVVKSPASVTRPTNAEEFWTLVHGVAETLLFGAALAAGVVAWYGLRSLKLARQDMVIRSTREARGLSLQRAEQFSQTIIQGEQRLTIRAELAGANVVSFTHQVASGAEIFDDEMMYRAGKKWWADVPAETKDRIIFFVNDLEAWAMYFTHELADADVVFGPCAPTFCSLIVQFAPWIIIARREQYSGFYPNIVGLFRAWRAELDAQDRGSKTEAWAIAARAAEERLAQHKLGAPLGTKVDL